jgi:hypothetical protein
VICINSNTAISGANLDEVNDIFKIRNAGASFNWVNKYSTNVIQKVFRARLINRKASFLLMLQKVLFKNRNSVVLKG